MAILSKKRQFIKAYNMAIVDFDTVEINMYGEVVSTYPVDWWTGEKIPGNFIAVDEFLEDLNEIKDKNNIIIHINSPGGDLYAGLSIYNRLKDLKGTVTTINDGLAASAASLIFQAGNVRKMNAGSNLMAHGVASLMIGYYNQQDMSEALKQLEAHNKAAIAVYAERSGRDEKEIRKMMLAESWLTGQEAIDAGLADEIIDGESVQMSMTQDQRMFTVNGMSFVTNRIPALPQGVRIINSTLPVAEKLQDSVEHEIGGKEQMTLDELRKQHPDLVAQIEADAENSGEAKERTRLQGIEAIENAIGDKAMVKNAKYGDKPISGEELAFVAMQAQAAIGVKVLSALEEDSKESGVNDVPAQPNGGAEESTDDQAEKEADIKEVMNLLNGRRNGGEK